jgi:hypothetical protein
VLLSYFHLSRGHVNNKEDKKDNKEDDDVLFHGGVISQEIL